MVEDHKIWPSNITRRRIDHQMLLFLLWKCLRLTIKRIIHQRKSKTIRKRIDPLMCRIFMNKSPYLIAHRSMNRLKKKLNDKRTNHETTWRMKEIGDHRIWESHRKYRLKPGKKKHRTEGLQACFCPSSALWPLKLWLFWCGVCVRLKVDQLKKKKQSTAWNPNTWHASSWYEY